VNKSFVTDTHPLLYYFTSAERKLTSKAQRAFDDALQCRSTLIYVPAVVLWEISILLERGRITLDMALPDWINTLFANPMILSQPFDETTIKHYHGLTFNEDPFDKAIVATALQLNLPLITNNSIMHDKQPCVVCWD
jgi:PIN domain nuclease of toxin-antitoxin system